MKKFLRRTLTMSLIFFALVATLELVFRLLKIPKIAQHDIYAKAQRLVPKITNNTILIIGDSRLEWGVKPIIVAEKLKEAGMDGNVVNMATPGKNGLDVLRYLVKNNIHPKIILQGYAPNFGGHKNHGTDTIEYNFFNRNIEALNYWLDEHCYFRDQSVWYYIKRTPLYFKSHLYDSLGGVTVTEYGDYKEREAEQQKMFNKFKVTYKPKELDNYYKEADSLIQKLSSRGSVVYGICMPISKPIYDLQNVTNGDNVPRIPAYHKFYDWASFTYTQEKPAPDSAFYYDGCHLNPEYAIVFTKKLMDSVLTDFKK